MSNGYGCYAWHGQRGGRIHKIGATLDWAGPVEIGGERPDISAWTASAAIAGNGFTANLAATLVWTGEATILRLFARPDEQGGWKEGRVWIDARLTAPDGTTLITPKAMFLLERPVTGG
ncbi:MAG: hypothetical protein LBF93_03555 [Zoogloeaceae bacterium]|jgi:hypothetical protein|nr:hypothetical protein [Zoogloeaceae bacterium]